MKATPRYINTVDFAPMDPNRPERWMLEQPFGQVTSDGHLIIAVPWKDINGASIPSPLWGLLGHPFQGPNKFWSVPHDQLYTRDALVFKLSDIADISPESLFLPMPSGGYVYELLRDRHTPKPRRWVDWAMHEAMSLGHEPEPTWKKCAAWSGVRLGAGRPWRRYRK